MKNYKLLINTNTKKYPIIVGDKISEKLSSIFKKNNINLINVYFLLIKI